MEKIKEIINKQTIKRIFIFTIIGVLIHLELIVRQSSNPDTLHDGFHHIAGAWEVSLGRWLNVIVSGMRFGLSTTIFSTITSIIIMMVSSIFIIDLLDIKRKTNKLYIFLLNIISPSFVVTLTYFYCSDVYNLSMLFAVLMPWCIFKLKDKKIISIFLGAICLTLSLAGYQSYLGVSMSLCIMVLILNLILKEKTYTFKLLLKDLRKIILTTILGFIIYGIISNIFLLVYNTGISDFKGANEVNIINLLINLPNSFIKAYRGFFEFFLKDNVINNTIFGRQFLNIILILLFSLLVIIKGIKSKKTIISIILILLLPLACNSILFLATSIKNSNALMSTPLFMIYIYLIAIIDKFEYRKVLLGVYAILSITIFTYIITINATYITVDLIKSQTVQIAERIRTNIEDTEGYTSKTKVCFVGSIRSSQLKKDIDFENMYNMSIGYISKWEYTWYGDYGREFRGWKDIYTKNLLLDFISCSKQEYNNIIESNEFKKMPLYPNKGSIKIINNIMVVKLTDKPYKN